MSDDPELRTQLLRTAQKVEEEIDRMRLFRWVMLCLFVTGLAMIGVLFWMQSQANQQMPQ